MPDPTRDSRPPRTASRDWSAHVRPRLAPLALPAAREREPTDEPSQPIETPEQAIESEPGDSALPWHRPDADDEPAEGRDPDRDQ